MRRRDARLVVEHRHELGVLGELRVKTLRSDDAAEALGAEEAREVDGGHAAARDGCVQDVPSERLG